MNTLSSLVFENENDPKFTSFENETIIDYISYRTSVQSIIYSLLKSGINKKEYCCILAKNSVPWHLIDVSMLSIGVITVPLSPREQIVTNFRHIRDLPISILVLDDFNQYQSLELYINRLPYLRTIIFISEKEKISNFSYRYFFYSNLIHSKISTSYREIDRIITAVHEDDIATISFTSGAEGSSVPCSYSHKDVMTSLNSFEAFTLKRIGHNSKTIIYIHQSHMMARFALFFAIKKGHSILISSISKKNFSMMHKNSPHYFFIFSHHLESFYKSIFYSSLISTKLGKVLVENNIKVLKNLSNEKIINNINLLLWKLSTILIFKKVRKYFFGEKLFKIFCIGPKLNDKIIYSFLSMGIDICSCYYESNFFGPITVSPQYKLSRNSDGVPLSDFQIKIILGKINIEKNNKSIETQDKGYISSDGEVFIKGNNSSIIKNNNYTYYLQQIEKRYTSSRYIDKIITFLINEKIYAVIGTKLSYFNNLENHGLTRYSNLSEVSRSNSIYKLLEKDIKSINSDFPHQEQIEDFIISPIELNVDNGFLSTSYKLKRKVVQERFQNNLEIFNS